VNAHTLNRRQWTVENEVLTAGFRANREVNRLTALDEQPWRQRRW